VPGRGRDLAYTDNTDFYKVLHARRRAAVDRKCSVGDTAFIRKM